MVELKINNLHTRNAQANPELYSAQTVVDVKQR